MGFLCLWVFFDGARPHIDESLIQFCTENGIILYCLPPNATHIMQPCDVSVFKVLKGYWKAVVHEHKQKTQKSLTKTNFAPTLKMAFDKLMTNKGVIINGFKRCGLYPFNREAVDYTKSISRKRKEFFAKSEESNPEISSQEFDSARRVIENVLGQANIDIFIQKKNLNENCNNSVFLLWETCLDVAAGCLTRDSYQANSEVISRIVRSEMLDFIPSDTFPGMDDHEDRTFSEPLDESGH